MSAAATQTHITSANQNNFTPHTQNNQHNHHDTDTHKLISSSHIVRHLTSAAPHNWTTLSHPTIIIVHIRNRNNTMLNRCSTWTTNFINHLTLYSSSSLSYTQTHQMSHDPLTLCLIDQITHFQYGQSRQSSPPAKLSKSSIRQALEWTDSNSNNQSRHTHPCIQFIRKTISETHQTSPSTITLPFTPITTNSRSNNSHTHSLKQYYAPSTQTHTGKY